MAKTKKSNKKTKKNKPKRGKSEQKKSKSMENKKWDKKENEEPGIQIKQDPFNVIDFALMTEKAIQSIELENKLVFIVKENSNKRDIKKAVENAFEKPVENVNSMIDNRGRKKAFIRFEEDGSAADIAMRLGII